MWPAATLLLAYAAWRPLSAPARSGVPLARVFIFPAVFTSLALGILVFDHFDGVNTLAVLLAASAIALAVARMALSFVDNLRMLRRRATTPSPTRSPGLPNRRAFVDDLARALETGGPVRRQTLGLYDLDGFKRYNDAYGHPAGDALLQRLASELADVVAGHGQAYRLGGDEFCLLLDADGSDAVLRAAAGALEASGDGFDVTASYGRVALPEDAAESEDALHLADRRMYAAKESRPSSAGLQTRSVLLKVLSEREPELHEHSTDVMRPRAWRRAAARPPARRARDRRARGGAPRHRQDGDPRRDPEQARATRRARVALHAPAHDHRRGHPQRGARSPARGDAGAGEPRALGRSGYPDGTAGEAIPEGARIVAVCDAFSAMIQERPYQPGVTVRRGGRRDRALRGRAFRPAGRRGVRGRGRLGGSPRMMRGLAPVLVALACLTIAPAAAQGAPGDIAVADEGSWADSPGRVLRIPSDGAVSLLAGGAPLSDPWAVAVAPGGALLVVDEGAEAVFSITPSGTVGHGRRGAGLQDPVGIALAPDGKAYVSDRQRDEVLRLDLATGALSRVAELQNATGIAMDSGREAAGHGRGRAAPHRSRDGRDHDRRVRRAARRAA